MSDSIVYSLVAVGIMLLVGFPIHEFSHAFAAYRLGDNTARWHGRLTLDPRVHFDQVGGMMLAISAVLSQGSFFFGWAKPTPVNPMNLQGGRRGEAIVAAAGPVSNLVMATLVALPLRVIVSSPESSTAFPNQLAVFIVQVLYFFVVLNVWLMIFNLIPVPPLDGWRVLLGLVPARTAWQLRDVEVRYGPMLSLVLFAVVFLTGARILGPIADTILNLLFGG